MSGNAGVTKANARLRVERHHPARTRRPREPLRGDSSRDRAALACDTPHRRARRHQWQRRRGQCSRECSGIAHVADGAQSCQRRRTHAQHRVVAQVLEVTRVQARAGREAELQLPHALIRALQIARLLPRRGHQRFLMLLHDARAERRDAAMTRIEIQLVEPRRGCARDGRARRMPLSVQRRREQRIGIRIDDQRFARRIDDLRQLGLERLLRVVGPRLEVARARAAAARLRAKAAHRPGTSPAARNPAR